MPGTINYHFTTIIGHDARVITPEATLPSNTFLNSDLPLVPVIIRSTFFFLAYSTIGDTIDVAVTTTSVWSIILLPLLLLEFLFVVASALFAVSLYPIARPIEMQSPDSIKNAYDSWIKWKLTGHRIGFGFFIAAIGSRSNSLVVGLRIESNLIRNSFGPLLQELTI